MAINDDPTFLAMLCEMLALQGYACHALVYAELEQELARLPALGPAAIILDVRLGHPEGGAMSVHEEWHDAGDPGVPRHLHRRHDELFYVLEGRMRFLVGAEEHVVGPGAVVYIPRGTVHAFRPAGQGPARQLLVVTLGGFEGYLDEMRTLPSPREAPAAWRDLQRRWDVEAVGPILEGP